MNLAHPPIPCPDCGAMMHLQEKPVQWRGGSKVAYLCERRVAGCRGLMSAHPDGRPCGIPANAYTRQARHILHIRFDLLWMDAPDMYGLQCPLKPAKLQKIARDRAYKWLAAHMGMAEAKCHISMMTLDELRQAWRIIEQHKPTDESIRAWVKARKGKDDGKS